MARPTSEQWRYAFVRRRNARLGVSLSLASLLLGLTAGSALAGEVTGNGRVKDVHGASECAFSGQEDLQWYTTDENDVPLENPVKGEPAHAQSWGQIPKAVRDEIAAFGAHPGTACNPTKAQAQG
jgi:hypothetical protein